MSGPDAKFHAPVGISFSFSEIRDQTSQLCTGEEVQCMALCWPTVLVMLKQFLNIVTDWKWISSICLMFNWNFHHLTCKAACAIKVKYQENVVIYIFGNRVKQCSCNKIIKYSVHSIFSCFKRFVMFKNTISQHSVGSLVRYNFEMRLHHKHSLKPEQHPVMNCYSAALTLLMFNQSWDQDIK